MIPAARIATQGRAVNALLWALIAIYGFSRVLQIYPGRFPMTAVVALHVLPPLIFALIHGARLYGGRGILMFVLVCAAIGNIFENVGVATGFPFGGYYFTSVMGPKIFHVPIFLGLAYVGMGYLSWTVARVILGGAENFLAGSHVVILPVVAALVMVSWDLAMDPVWSNLVQAWVWQNGGAYFGVPVSNFAGWFFTNYLMYQLFALFLRSRIHASSLNSRPAGYWRLAIVFYGVSAAGNLLFALPHRAIATVTDAAGVQWRVASIVEACALVSIFVMGGFTALAAVRAGELSAQVESRRAF